MSKTRSARKQNRRDLIFAGKKTFFTGQRTSAARQEKNRIMSEQGLKTGKQYRRWVKDHRRIIT